MTPTQNLYYALGEMAYAVAKADGDIQNEEKHIIHALVAKEIKDNNIDFDYSEIIFNIMSRDKTDVETSYDWALNEIRLNKHYFTEEIKAKFLSVLEKVAQAFPPITGKEKEIQERFKRDLEKL